MVGSVHVVIIYTQAFVSEIVKSQLEYLNKALNTINDHDEMYLPLSNMRTLNKNANMNSLV